MGIDGQDVSRPAWTRYDVRRGAIMLLTILTIAAVTNGIRRQRSWMGAVIRVCITADGFCV